MPACNWCGYPEQPGQAIHADCARKRIDQLERSLTALRLTARVLLQNAEGCAINHHGGDYYLHGEPGWLKDCRRSIEQAEADLINSPEGV